MVEDNSSNEQDERRTHDRSRLIVDLFFNGQDVTGIASTKDISVGGLYLNTQANLPEGERLLIRIPLAEEKQIVATAEVVYRNEGRGVGLRFQGLSKTDRMLIEHELRNVGG